MIFSFESTPNAYINPVRLLIIAVFISFSTFAQSPSTESETAPLSWIDQLNLSGGFPEKLLSTRSAVFHDYNLTHKELKDAQEYFQRTGIDAVSYFRVRYADGESRCDKKHFPITW